MNKNKGFSLIEVMLSVAVLAIAIIGMLTLLVPAQQAGQLNTDRLIARQLAQEGLALAEFQRNTNSANATDFFKYMHDGTSGSEEIFRNQCYDPKIWDTEEPLKYEVGLGFQYNSGITSKFSRTMKAFLSSTNDYLDLTSTVTWNDHDQEQSYSVKTRLYDIY